MISQNQFQLNNQEDQNNIDENHCDLQSYLQHKLNQNDCLNQIQKNSFKIDQNSKMSLGKNFDFYYYKCSVQLKNGMNKPINCIALIQIFSHTRNLQITMKNRIAYQSQHNNEMTLDLYAIAILDNRSLLTIFEESIHHDQLIKLNIDDKIKIDITCKLTYFYKSLLQQGKLFSYTNQKQFLWFTKDYQPKFLLDFIYDLEQYERRFQFQEKKQQEIDKSVTNVIDTNGVIDNSYHLYANFNLNNPEQIQSILDFIKKQINQNDYQRKSQSTIVQLQNYIPYIEQVLGQNYFEFQQKEISKLNPFILNKDLFIERQNEKPVILKQNQGVLYDFKTYTFGEPFTLNDSYHLDRYFDGLIFENYSFVWFANRRGTEDDYQQIFQIFEQDTLLGQSKYGDWNIYKKDTLDLLTGFLEIDENDFLKQYTLQSADNNNNLQINSITSITEYTIKNNKQLQQELPFDQNKFKLVQKPFLKWKYKEGPLIENEYCYLHQGKINLQLIPQIWQYFNNEQILILTQLIVDEEDEDSYFKSFKPIYFYVNYKS